MTTQSEPNVQYIYCIIFGCSQYTFLFTLFPKRECFFTIKQTRHSSKNLFNIFNWSLFTTLSMNKTQSAWGSVHEFSKTSLSQRVLSTWVSCKMALNVGCTTHLSACVFRYALGSEVAKLYQKPYTETHSLK